MPLEIVVFIKTWSSVTVEKMKQLCQNKVDPVHVVRLYSAVLAFVLKCCKWNRAETIQVM